MLDDLIEAVTNELRYRVRTAAALNRTPGRGPAIETEIRLGEDRITDLMRTEARGLSEEYERLASECARLKARAEATEARSGFVSGDLHVRSAGAKLSGLRVAGSIYVEAPNVTIENCVFEAPGQSTDSVQRG